MNLVVLIGTLRAVLPRPAACRRAPGWSASRSPPGPATPSRDSPGCLVRRAGIGRPARHERRGRRPGQSAASILPHRRGADRGPNRGVRRARRACQSGASGRASVVRGRGAPRRSRHRHRRVLTARRKAMAVDEAVSGAQFVHGGTAQAHHSARGPRRGRGLRRPRGTITHRTRVEEEGASPVERAELGDSEHEGVRVLAVVGDDPGRRPGHVDLRQIGDRPAAQL